jgi:hypothetical protein
MSDLFSSTVLLSVTQAAAVAVLTYGAEPRKSKRTSRLTGAAYVKELLDGHLTRFEEIFHMPKETFLALQDFLIERQLLKKTKRNFLVEEQTAIFLFIVCGNNSNRQAQERFQHSGETITR